MIYARLYELYPTESVSRDSRRTPLRVGYKYTHLLIGGCVIRPADPTLFSASSFQKRSPRPPGCVTLAPFWASGTRKPSGAHGAPARSVAGDGFRGGVVALGHATAPWPAVAPPVPVGWGCLGVRRPSSPGQPPQRPWRRPGRHVRRAGTRRRASRPADR